MLDFEKYTENFVYKMDKFLDDRYSDNELKRRKKRSKRVLFYEDYYSEYNEDISDIGKQWFQGNQFPTLKKLINICNLYQIDMDYFLTDQDEYNKINKSIADELHLHKESVERLRNYSEKEIRTLDSLMFSPNPENTKDYLQPLLHSLFQYQSLKMSEYTDVTIHNNSLEYENSFHGTDASNYLRYTASLAFEDCLNAPLYSSHSYAVFRDAAYKLQIQGKKITLHDEMSDDK